MQCFFCIGHIKTDKISIGLYTYKVFPKHHFFLSWDKCIMIWSRGKRNTVNILKTPFNLSSILPSICMIFCVQWDQTKCSKISPRWKTSDLHTQNPFMKNLLSFIICSGFLSKWHINYNPSYKEKNLSADLNFSKHTSLCFQVAKAPGFPGFFCVPRLVEC